MVGRRLLLVAGLGVLEDLEGPAAGGQRVVLGEESIIGNENNDSN